MGKNAFSDWGQSLCEGLTDTPRSLSLLPALLMQTLDILRTGKGGCLQFFEGKSALWIEIIRKGSLLKRQAGNNTIPVGGDLRLLLARYSRHILSVVPLFPGRPWQRHIHSDSDTERTGVRIEAST